MEYQKSIFAKLDELRKLIKLHSEGKPLSKPKKSSGSKTIDRKQAYEDFSSILSEYDNLMTNSYDYYYDNSDEFPDVGYNYQDRNKQKQKSQNQRTNNSPRQSDLSVHREHLKKINSELKELDSQIEASLSPKSAKSISPNGYQKNISPVTKQSNNTTPKSKNRQNSNRRTPINKKNQSPKKSPNMNEQTNKDVEIEGDEATEEKIYFTKSQQNLLSDIPKNDNINENCANQQNQTNDENNEVCVNKEIQIDTNEVAAQPEEDQKQNNSPPHVKLALSKPTENKQEEVHEEENKNEDELSTSSDDEIKQKIRMNDAQTLSSDISIEIESNSSDITKPTESPHKQKVVHPAETLSPIISSESEQEKQQQTKQQTEELYQPYANFVNQSDDDLLDSQHSEPLKETKPTKKDPEFMDPIFSSEEENQNDEDDQAVLKEFDELLDGIESSNSSEEESGFHYQNISDDLQDREIQAQLSIDGSFEEDQENQKKGKSNTEPLLYSCSSNEND